MKPNGVITGPGIKVVGNINTYQPPIKGRLATKEHFLGITAANGHRVIAGLRYTRKRQLDVSWELIHCGIHLWDGFQNYVVCDGMWAHRTRCHDRSHNDHSARCRAYRGT